MFDADPEDVVRLLDEAREELFTLAPAHEKLPTWYVELRARLDRRLREAQLAATGLGARAA